MKVEKLALYGVFDGTERLEAPLFQRPYVWKRERNWEPLWESIQAVADAHLQDRKVRPHFLGTIVLDQLKTGTGKLHARQIIDGQQRLTTLQLALAAIRDYCQEQGESRFSQAFRKLTDNDVPLSDDPDDVFKVWPTNADRPDFRDVMLAGSTEAVRQLPHAAAEDEWLIPDAYLYFVDTLKEWLGPVDNPEFQNRLKALYATLRDGLHLVVIDLDENDDAQVIFETLNALGTPLLPADLVKNFLFHLAEGQGHDTTQLYKRYWEVFDTEKSYWREEVRQGRLRRPRLDLFLNHYLAMMTGDEVNASTLFSTYREFVSNTNGQCPAKHMQVFRTYADVYRRFDAFPANTRAGVFFYRLGEMDTTTVYPLLLEVLKRYGSGDDRPELERILVDLESFFVRRAVCELTPKNYNRFFIEMVKVLREQNDFSATAVRKYLLEQTADTSCWPQDKEFHECWMTIRFYKRLHKRRARMILEAIEEALHTGKTEKVQIEKKLSIEHLLPQHWEEHWPLPSDVPEDKREARSQLREKMLHMVGNLTLVTKRLNPAISNGPWFKTREQILKHSALNLNRAFLDTETWDEEIIEKRSATLFETAVKLWPYPADAASL